MNFKCTEVAIAISRDIRFASGIKFKPTEIYSSQFQYGVNVFLKYQMNAISDGILPKRPYPPCLRMADRALLAGSPSYDNAIVVKKVKSIIDRHDWTMSLAVTI